MSILAQPGLGALLVDLTVRGEAESVALLDVAARAARPADDRVTADPAPVALLDAAGGGLRRRCRSPPRSWSRTRR
jgi:hypothetical protein